MDISGQGPDDTAPTHLKDMVFSNRIYLYYENPDFSLTDKGLIEDFYRRRSLSIQFRDDKYSWAHREDKRAVRKEPLVPNSIVLPPLTSEMTGLRIFAKNLGEGISGARGTMGSADLTVNEGGAK